MIKKVSHTVPAGGPAALTLALAVAHELHAPATAPAPAPAPRAPEVAQVPELMGLRTSADRPHRRKVPLHRLSTVHRLGAMKSLSALGV
ncbi:hypothetical protein AQJ66_07620 [Streptomyces bungoensis]|uniref:Uncharacterized protein n=1 Tax=Streptomyces bungoensis TaxID=285568 RepID=A0A101T9H5_9ACTN|nr:hypothetical protein [Streptomyces bungoensis]KUN88217.1 hypothetical protein AQJ66_07620 [Streptomyces bungoensis]